MCPSIIPDTGATSVNQKLYYNQMASLLINSQLRWGSHLRHQGVSELPSPSQALRRCGWGSLFQFSLLVSHTQSVRDLWSSTRGTTAWGNCYTGWERTVLLYSAYWNVWLQVYLASCFTFPVWTISSKQKGLPLVKYTVCIPKDKTLGWTFYMGYTWGLLVSTISEGQT